MLRAVLMNRGLISLLLLLSLPTWAAPAKPTQITHQMLDAELEVARGHFKAKRFNKALVSLDQVLARSAHWPGYTARVQFFRARCLMDLHRPDDAREALERFIVLSASQEDKRRGRVWLAKLQRRFYGSVRVVCSDGKLQVSVAKVPGKPRHCPAQWDGLKPGKYAITITGGKQPKTLSVELFAGKRLTYDLEK